MRITLNNRLTELNFNEISVSKLLEEQKFSFRLLTVRVNNVVIKKEDRSLFIIKDGDKVDVIHMMSGG